MALTEAQSLKAVRAARGRQTGNKGRDGVAFECRVWKESRGARLADFLLARLPAVEHSMFSAFFVERSNMLEL